MSSCSTNDIRNLGELGLAVGAQVLVAGNATIWK
jgi:hypothetical protein